MTTIDVTVTGGTVPAPIQMEIDKKNIPNYPLFESNNSFKKNLDLSKGTRTISFTVKNPSGGKTVITVSGMSSNGNPFVNKKTIEGNEIRTAIFKLVI